PKKIMLLETNYPYTTHSGIGISQWPSTPAGQEQEFLAVRNMMLGLPHNDGLGMLYWYPEAVQVPGFNIYNGGATALFDATSSHNALQTVTNNDFLVVGPGDFTADGHLSIADVQAMMAALSDPGDFKTAHNFTDADLLKIGDLNGDHVFNNSDLQSLLSMMANNAAAGGAAAFAAVPEPNTCALLLIGITVLGSFSLRMTRVSTSSTP
ncbi:MAG TPA: glycosyl hydrolase 53 family protein, partial [Pirellulales bacterium]